MNELYKHQQSAKMCCALFLKLFHLFMTRRECCDDLELRSVRLFYVWINIRCVNDELGECFFVIKMMNEAMF